MTLRPMYGCLSSLRVREMQIKTALMPKYLVSPSRLAKIQNHDTFSWQSWDDTDPHLHCGMGARWPLPGGEILVKAEENHLSWLCPYSHSSDLSVALGIPPQNLGSVFCPSAQQTGDALELAFSGGSFHTTTLKHWYNTSNGIILRLDRCTITQHDPSGLSSSPLGQQARYSMLSWLDFLPVSPMPPAILK